MTTQATDRKALADRLEHYLAERARMSRLDPNDIHGLHVGTDREVVLTGADLRQAVAILRQEPSVEDLAKFLYPIIADAADFYDFGFDPYEVAANEPGNHLVYRATEAARAIAAMYGGSPIVSSK